MKKIIALIFLFTSFGSHASEELTIHSQQIQAACESLMSELLQEYGKSFICVVDNNIAAAQSAAFATDHPRPGSGGYMVHVYDITADDPSDPISTMHFSYDEKDIANLKMFLSSGEGLTKKELAQKSCQMKVDEMNQNIKENNDKLKYKEISTSEYETSNSIFIDLRNRFQTCVNQNK